MASRNEIWRVSEVGTPEGTLPVKPFCCTEAGITVLAGVDADVADWARSGPTAARIKSVEK